MKYPSTKVGEGDGEAIRAVLNDLGEDALLLQRGSDPEVTGTRPSIEIEAGQVLSERAIDHIEVYGIKIVTEGFKVPPLRRRQRDALSGTPAALHRIRFEGGVIGDRLGDIEDTGRHGLL